MRASDYTAVSPGSLASVTDALGRPGFAFVPNRIGTANLDLASRELRIALSAADRELARLDGTVALLDHPEQLFRGYLKREAVLSSAIEGTHSTLADLVLFEASAHARSNDDIEVSRYVDALDYGRLRIAELPLGRTLFRELHETLMRGGDESATPGNFRDCLVFVGQASFEGARFVPPPPIFVDELLADLEQYLADDPEVPLIKLALAHYQFEAIHPFRDGNGRLGRLMISLWLEREEILLSPMLYLSAYFERNKQEYYDRLLRVSTEGDWNGWVLYFLNAVATQAHDAMRRTKQLAALRTSYRVRLAGPRAPAGLQRLVDTLFATPAISVPIAVDLLNITYAAAKAQVMQLVARGILKPEPVVLSGTAYYVADEIIQMTSQPLNVENAPIFSV